MRNGQKKKGGGVQKVFTRTVELTVNGEDGELDPNFGRLLYVLATPRFQGADVSGCWSHEGIGLGERARPRRS